MEEADVIPGQLHKVNFQQDSWANLTSSLQVAEKTGGSVHHQKGNVTLYSIGMDGQLQNTPSR